MRRSSSSALPNAGGNSWIHPCTPISWRPECMIAGISSGCSSALTAGMKNVEEIWYLSRSARMRGSPSCAPKSAAERVVGDVCPPASSHDSLSSSKLRTTATRALLGHVFGVSFRPARTGATAARSCSLVQRTPGCWGGVCCAPLGSAAMVVIAPTSVIRTSQVLFIAVLLLWLVFRLDRRFRRAVDDLPVEHRHLALQVLECRRPSRVEVVIPRGEVGVLSHLDRAGFLIQEHLMRRPDRVRAQRSVDVDRLRAAERILRVRTQEGLARYRCPEAVARGAGHNGEIGSIRPDHPFGEEGLERIEAERPLRPEVRRVHIT